LGVDVDQLVYFNPDTVSEVFDTLEKVADGKDKQMGEDTPMLFVWDSVASTSTMQEIETQDLDQRMYATAAPQISRALRVHARRISKSHVCCVFTNQAKKKLGVMFGDDETTYGGKAISYHSTVRLRLSVGKRIKSDNRSVGMWVHVETRKNKLAPPMQSVSVPMYYGEGIYEDEALVAFGVKLGIIESFKNGWYALHLPKQSIKFTKRTWPDVLDEQWGEIEAHFRMVHNGR
jgi:recombination protein RecA